MGLVRSYTNGGGKKWRFTFYSPNGDRVRRQGFPTRESANEAMLEEQVRRLALTDPTKLSVRDYFERWLAEREARGAIRTTTAASYRRSLAAFLEVCGALRLDQLSPAHLDDHYRQLLTAGGRDGTGLSASTVRTVHVVIHTALSEAVRKGLVAVNPAGRADPPSSSAAKPAERKVWSVEDAQAFLGAPWLPTYRRVAWETALRTGLRRGELAALRWDRFDSDGTLHVLSSRAPTEGGVIESAPKSERSRRSVVLDDDLVDRLRRWRTEQGALCLRLGRRAEFILTDALLGEWDPTVMSHAWKRDVDRAVAEGIVSFPMRLHDCRHWHATQLIAAGVDLNTVSNRLGHASPAFTLSVYGHSDQRRDREAAAAVSAVLGAG